MMMSISQKVSVIKQTKEANEIVSVAGRYMELRLVGQTYRGACPFHEDHQESFSVDQARQRYRCWACGKFGDVITFIQEIERVDFRKAMEILGNG